MSTDGATQFMEAQQLVTIKDMFLFHTSKAQYLMEIKNRKKTGKTNKFDMSVQKKVAAFIYWVS